MEHIINYQYSRQMSCVCMKVGKGRFVIKPALVALCCLYSANTQGMQP